MNILSSNHLFFSDLDSICHPDGIGALGSDRSVPAGFVNAEYHQVDGGYRINTQVGSRFNDTALFAAYIGLIRSGSQVRLLGNRWGDRDEVGLDVTSLVEEAKTASAAGILLADPEDPMQAEMREHIAAVMGRVETTLPLSDESRLVVGAVAIALCGAMGAIDMHTPEQQWSDIDRLGSSAD